MRPLLARLSRDETGTTMIEFSIVMVLFFTLTFGLAEFGFALYQYNSAGKAVQLGARLAAVSNPVWGDLTTQTSTGTPGGPWTGNNFNVTCTSTNATGSAGNCSGTSNTGYTATAMQNLVFGRGQTACGGVGTDGDLGMCDIFWRIRPNNVRVNYSFTGLGFAGRPGGPVPTITLTLTGLTFQFFGLSGFMGFDQITMPDFTVTMTGEDLNGAAVP